MKPTTARMMVTATVVCAAAVVTTGVAMATGSDDRESPLTGAALERASQVALAHTGGGRVTDTEVDDEDSWIEIEVTLEDGSQVDVQLDRDFKVVSANADIEDGD